MWETIADPRQSRMHAILVDMASTKGPAPDPAPDHKRSLSKARAPNGAASTNVMQEQSGWTLKLQGMQERSEVHARVLASW